MSDSGKHSALRQTGDGSFELVFEDGLEEISEDAPTDVDATVDTARPPSGASRRILAIGAVVGALLVAVAIGVWVASPGGSSGAGDGGDGERGASGFKPYAGEGERPSTSRTPPAEADDLDEPSVSDEDLEEEVLAETEEVIEEDEAGWELAEEEVVVIEEQEDGEALLEEEAGEVDEEAEEDLEEEALEEEEFEEEEFEEAPEDLDARRRQLRPDVSSVGRPITPRIPNLGQGPNGVRNLPELPVRRINPSTGTLEDVEEPLGDEAYDDELYDEEPYEDQPYDEY